MGNNLLLQYRPQKNIKLKYKIIHTVTGEKDGVVILNSNLDIIASYRVVHISDNGENSTIEFLVEKASFLSNNTKKNGLYENENILLTLNSQNLLIERQSNLPYGILDYIYFPFTDKEVKPGLSWNGPLYTICPNMNKPVEVKSCFHFEKFEGFKGYNCANISFNIEPKIIDLTDTVRQTLVGNGNVLFDPIFGIFTFLTMTSFLDTGSLGISFKAFFKQELVPSVKTEKPPDLPADINSSEQYFIRY